MEQSLDHCAFHKGDHARAHNGFGIDAGVGHADDVVEVEARHSFHHEHSSRDEFGVWPRDHEAVLLEVFEHACHVEHVRGFHSEVEFFNDGLGEQLDQGRGIGESSDGNASDEVWCEPCHHPQVASNAGAYGGALHLDHNLFAGAQCCRVHLCNRGGSEGSGVEERKDVFDASSEIGFNREANIGPRFGSNLVSAQLELVHQLGGEQTVAARDDLAKLDVGGAKLFGSLAETQRNIGTAHFG